MNNNLAFPLISILAVVFANSAAYGDDCNKELSTDRECWYNCKTESEITICDIAYCPEGVQCAADMEAGQLAVSIPIAEPNTPRVGDELIKYVDGRRARGKVQTRAYNTVSVDTATANELVVIVTPFLTTPPTTDDAAKVVVVRSAGKDIPTAYDELTVEQKKRVDLALAMLRQPAGNRPPASRRFREHPFTQAGLAFQSSPEAIDIGCVFEIENGVGCWFGDDFCGIIWGRAASDGLDIGCIPD